jgi:hypothetical protein
VTENDGSTPDITRISPVNKTVPVLATTYYVEVDTPGAWQVIAPDLSGTSRGSWATAEIVAGGVGGLNGSGPGTVKITVLQNATNLWWYATFEIAGISHELTQDYIIRR